jgi:asparagine synthase (glutamine-hydrolysing)
MVSKIMCGILLVQSRDFIPLSTHLMAFDKLKNRGPNFDRYKYENNIFIGQTVLHITGNDHYYHQDHPNFLAYNGEIYNFKQFGRYSNDIEFVHNAVENNMDQLKQGWGPWAWAWTDGTTVRYASDPQGEKCLFRYQDDHILIVSSEVAPILTYIDAKKVSQDYTTRHWCMISDTPYQGISRISPGYLYQSDQDPVVIDSMWSWIRPVNYSSINEAQEEFNSIWKTVTRQIRPTCPAALTYSGGLDTGIILSHMPDLELYATNMVGKDPIVDHIKDFLTTEEQSRLHCFRVDPEAWGQAFNSIIARTRMPVQSWSFVGQWIINANCQQKVLLTGVGADELFGGYDVYQKLDYTTEYSTSPYSYRGDPTLWNKCLQSYDQDPQQATLLMDYFYQIAGCDQRGVDLIAGQWGIESRNPFLSALVIKFALNLPIEYKIGSVPKPLIRNLYSNRWDPAQIMPKKGFSGHCNDSLPWINVDITPSGDRDQDWHRIVLDSFYTAANRLEH